jgi:predicted N-acyltransferase
MEVLTDGRPVAEELHVLYLQTHLRSRLRFERLTLEYFQEISERMPDRVRLFVWRQSGKMIAFSLCMLHNGTLYDLDVGLDYSVALDLHLYFVTLRDVFQWAVRHGVTEYQTGPLNYDPKLHLKMLLAPQDLYAKHLTSWINPFFKIALKYLEPTRHDRTIRKFANAHEL